MMNEMRQDRERTPKLEKLDNATRVSVVTRLQEELEDVLVNPANIRIKENLVKALTLEDEAADAAFKEARGGLLQRGVLTWNRLHELIAECEKTRGQTD